MLVVLSDLHLTDGTTSSNVDSSAFKTILLPEIVSNARLKNAKEVRIVLLGDIYDLLRTDVWVSKVEWNNRPWNGTLDPETGMNQYAGIEGHYLEILNNIFNTTSARGLADSISTIKQEIGYSISVKVIYIIGNHDRALNVFDSLRQAIKKEYYNVDSFEFMNSLAIQEYNVFFRHGHEFDEDCYGYSFLTKVLQKGLNIDKFDAKCYKVQTIGEVITAELMGGFIAGVKKNFQDTKMVKQLMEINNIRPLSNALYWIDWFVGKTDASDANKNLIFNLFKSALDGVLESDFAKRWDDIKTDLIISGDLVDRLQLISKTIKNDNFNDLKFKLNLISKLDIFSSSKDDLVEGAKDYFLKPSSPDTQFVLYGHTHIPRTDYFSGSVNGNVKMYINTGTYLPFIIKTADDSFVSTYQMTMAFLYREDEDINGKANSVSIDLWNGLKRKNYN